MAHKIMGNRFISRVQPAWHNIAQEIFDKDTKITAREAMVKVAGDIEVIKTPLYYRQDGQEMTADDKVAVLRKPTVDDPQFHMLGIASDSWVADSYANLASALDELPQKGYPVETAGLLQDGGLAFVSFRGEDWAVRGDEMRSYFTGNFSLQPGIGHKVMHSPVRVVCWNTNQMADQQATINLSIQHSKDALNQIKLVSKLVTQFAEMKDKAKAIFELFADKQITQKDVDTIIYAAYQLPALPSKIRLFKEKLNQAEQEAFKGALTPLMLMDLQKAEEVYERQCEQIREVRIAAQESFEKFEPAKLRGTAWAAYNAVTEVSDWRDGRKADESALFGSRSKEKSRAYIAAMEIVGAK